MDKALGKGAVFVASEREGIKVMQDKEGGEVRPVCGPPNMKQQYFIGRTGQMYVCRPYKGEYVCYICKYQLNNKTTPFYEFATTNNSRLRCNISRLLYCTYVIGYWDEDVDLRFADGNSLNTHLDNIVKRERITDRAATNMRGMEAEYKNFNFVVYYIVFFYSLAIEEAQDIAQDAFIEMAEDGCKVFARNFVGLWIHKACQMAINSYHIKNRIISMDQSPVQYGKTDADIDLGILSYLGHTKDRQCFELYLQGATMKEIAEETNTPFSSVGSHLRRSKCKLRKILLQDKIIAQVYS